MEETPGIWEEETGQIVKKGKLEVGAVPTMRDLILDGGEGEHADLVMIATLQGWEGPWSFSSKFQDPQTVFFEDLKRVTACFMTC
ncbi:hypothetical protein OROHE_008707 [Orobanche hederae]